MGDLSYAAPRVLAPARRHLVAPFLLGAASVGTLGAAHGGYFTSSWGWAIVGAIAAIAWALATGEILQPTAPAVVLVAGLSALAAWFAISSFWGVAAEAVDEAARVLVFVALVACAILVVRRTGVTALAGGVLSGAAVVVAYALATRLFPDRIGTFDSVAAYRLATPVGYWNALGLLCAVALLLALAVVSSSDSPVTGALAAATTPVFTTALYFTFSRGSWLALAVGFVVALAVTPERLRLTATALALAVPSSIGAFAGSRFSALTHQHATVARAAHQGHRLALFVVILLVAAALLAAAVVALRGRLTLPDVAEVGYAFVLVLAAAAVVVATVVRYGGPISAVRRGWDSFSAPPPKAQLDLRKRLFSFSSSRRVDLWRAALHEFDAHPLAGGGAGSYESYWLRHRTTTLKVRDAHSLYLETLAELGVVGLLLLVVALLAPLVAAVRTRRNAFVPAATGAYVAFLVHAGVDWDWEIASVTLAGLLVGVALLAGARPDTQPPLSSRARYGVLAVALAVGVFGFVFLVGNMFLARGASAASDGHWQVAAKDARRAQSWLPWSSEPWRQAGEAELAQGDTRTARAQFRTALKKDSGDWSLWLDLARASAGRAQRKALAQAEVLDPRSPEIAELKQELGAGGGISIGVGK